MTAHAYTGYEIPKYYDSLIAKLLAWGRNRDEAIARMKRALEEFRATGVKTTVPFHLKMMENQNFRAGKYSTRFLEDFKM